MIGINNTTHLITLPFGTALVPGEPKDIEDETAKLLQENPIVKLYLQAKLVEFKPGSLQESVSDALASPVLENQQPTISASSRLAVFDKASLEEVPTIGTKGAEKVLANQPKNGYESIDAMAAANADVTTIDWAKVRAYLNK